MIDRPDFSAGSSPYKHRSKSRSRRNSLDEALGISRKTAATLAVMQLGITDYDAIATAAGITVDEVKEIDSAEDISVRWLAAGGIPHGIFFNLRKKIFCPACGTWITVVPCVACGGRRFHSQQASSEAMRNSGGISEEVAGE